MSLFDKKKLMQVAKERGYMTSNAVVNALVPVFKLPKKTIEARINTGSLSKEECEVIGSFFEMTMKEYYDVFMSGLFQEDGNGHYVCHIEEPYYHMHSHLKQQSKRIVRQNPLQILTQLDKIE